MVRNLVPRRDDLLFPFEQAFDDFFKDFFKSNPLDRVKGAGSFPKMDIYEQNGQFVVLMAVSGMKPDDIYIEVTPEDVLVIRGRMNDEYRAAPDANKGAIGITTYLKELRASAFERQVKLPEHIKGDPKAIMKDGVLKLTWAVEQVVEPEPRKIPISVE